jgi:hypothetical protein
MAIDLPTVLERLAPAPTGAGVGRATTDETHRLVLVHPEYDGFVTLEVRALTDLADVRVLPGETLDRYVTAHHVVGPLRAGQRRPVDLELHVVAVAGGRVSGALRVVDATDGSDVAPPVRLTIGTDRRLDCVLAGAVDGPWSAPSDFEDAVDSLVHGRVGARKLAQLVERTAGSRRGIIARLRRGTGRT